ncbi:hypothetical protein BC628DRAFT_858152 [Trametes gibbosa]|nr:hypothetical protein BC628DRAFT_858152 [Trametes gibbosa]
MHLLELNSDVLVLIANVFLDRADVSRCTMTCRHLRDTLSSSLLKSYIYLDRRSFRSFCQFIWGGSGPQDCTRDRTPFLRTLTNFRLYETDESPDDDQLIPVSEAAQIFTSLAQHLVYVCISRPSVGYTPEQLRLALSTLPCLQEVQLRSITDEYRDALAGVGPQLRFVGLHMTQDFLQGMEPMAGPLDPLPFLRHHRSTITSLNLTKALLYDHGEPLPNVRKLVTSDFSPKDGDTPWAAPLIHLFPNVEYVYLWLVSMRDGSYLAEYLDVRDSTAMARVDRLRAMGKAWQAAHGTWTNGLRYLSLRSLTDLYCLGLSCHVSRIDVCRGSTSLEIDSMALSDCRPRCVQFDLQTNVGNIDEWRSYGPPLLHAIAQTRSVVHLICNIHEPIWYYVNLLESLAHLGTLLRETAVSHVVLHLAEHDRDWTPEKHRLFGWPLWDVTSTPRRSDGSLELPEILQLLGGNDAKLQRVFIRHERSETRAWEAHQVGTEPNMRWEELPPARAIEIMEAEGLIRRFPYTGDGEWWRRVP